MKQGKLWRTLDNFAAQEVGRTDLWPAIREQLPRRPSPFLRRPMGRLGWIAAMMGALLIISTVAYATAPLLTGVYSINPAWDGLAEKSHPVSLSQTVEGCTVTIEQAYADAGRIVIGGTLSGPEGMSLSPTRTRLTDATGIVLQWIDGAGYVPEGGEEASAWLLSFDPSVLVEIPSELHLRLSLHLSGVVIGEAAPPIAPPAEADGGVNVVELSPIETTLYGPFTFEFTLPVIR